MFDKKVVDYFMLNKCPGDVGIEIEMEMNRQYSHDIWEEGGFGSWRIEKDHSLRGHSAELVLNRPVGRSKIKGVLCEVVNQMQKQNISIKPTIRAGVHVHINMQQSTIGELLKMMMTYYPLETLLTRYCGDGREGNLFCLRNRDAEGNMHLLMKALKEGNLMHMQTNDLRYSAMNLQSLFQYGSVEFRAMSTTSDILSIEEWCDILLRIKDYSRKVGSCWDNINNISGMGQQEWVESILGKDITKKLWFDGAEYEIMEDVRAIQHACFKLKAKGL